MNAIEVDGLTKDFAAGRSGARIRALDRVTLRVAEGEVVGLLGPNGSGKSTLLKILLGLLLPTAGECRLFGASGAPAGMRAAVGYLPEAPEYCPHLSGFEVVWFHARLSGLPRPGLAERVERALAAVALAGAMHRRAATYSRGMRQRLGLAQALVHDPRLVILDEPMAGLDPVAIDETGRLIGRLKAQGRTVLLSSHLLGQVAEICDRVALLDHGRLILEGRVVELARRGDQSGLRVDGLPAAALDDLRQWLEARGARLHAAEACRLDLERVFLAAVQSDRARGPGVS